MRQLTARVRFPVAILACLTAAFVLGTVSVPETSGQLAGKSKTKATKPSISPADLQKLQLRLKETQKAFVDDTADLAIEFEKAGMLEESKKLLQQVKDAGVAGIISYIFWEWAFWGVSIPVCIFGYYQVTGHWPDLSNSEDQAKLGAEAFAFVNVARFAVPLRIGLALSTTPWVQQNLVDRFQKDK